jgi:hypothetical protein
VNLDADRRLINPSAHGSLTTKDCCILDDLWTHVERPKLAGRRLSASPSRFDLAAYTTLSHRGVGVVIFVTDCSLEFVGVPH